MAARQLATSTLVTEAVELRLFSLDGSRFVKSGVDRMVGLKITSKGGVSRTPGSTTLSQRSRLNFAGRLDDLHKQKLEELGVDFSRKRPAVVRRNAVKRSQSKAAPNIASK